MHRIRTKRALRRQSLATLNQVEAEFGPDAVWVGNDRKVETQYLFAEAADNFKAAANGTVSGDPGVVLNDNSAVAASAPVSASNVAADAMAISANSTGEGSTTIAQSPKASTPAAPCARHRQEPPSMNPSGVDARLRHQHAHSAGTQAPAHPHLPPAGEGVVFRA